MKIKMPVSKTANVADWIMRLALAFVFITSSYSKLFSVGVAAFAQDVKVSLWLAWVATIVELLAGLGFIIGKLIKNEIGDWITRLSGLSMIIFLIFALVLVKYAAFANGLFAGLEWIYDLIALSAMSWYYLLKPRD